MRRYMYLGAFLALFTLGAAGCQEGEQGAGEGPVEEAQETANQALEEAKEAQETAAEALEAAKEEGGATEQPAATATESGETPAGQN